MFQNLKTHITKENLDILRRKNRYAEDQALQKQQSPSRFSRGQRQMPNKQQEYKKSPSQSQDSLSDYQIQEREEIFNILANDQPALDSKVDKQSEYFPQRYYTPQSKIKELQRSNVLSEERLKLAEQFHARQIRQMAEKNQRKVLEMGIQIEKLKIQSNFQQQRQIRAKELTKQNASLKQLLSLYEEKYWGFQQMQKTLITAEAQSKFLKAEITKLRQIISQDKVVTAPQKRHDIEAKQILEKQKINDNIQRLSTSQQKQIGILGGRIKEMERSADCDRKVHEEVVLSLKNKIQQLQENNSFKQTLVNDQKSQISKLKHDKQKLQKSLMETITNFSRHLSNQSVQNTRNYMVKSVVCLNQQTINLDLNEEYDDKFHTRNKQNNELHKVSPVLLKRVKFDQGQKINRYNLSHQAKLVHQIQNEAQIVGQSQLAEQQKVRQKAGILNQIYKRTRIMSHQHPQKQKLGYGNKISHVPDRADKKSQQTVFDPQKNQECRMSRLQKKLQKANLKIVQLLRQKAQKGSKTY